MDIAKRMQLIERNTQEIIGKDELLQLFKSKPHPVVYLGTSITGKPHIGYFVWGLKLTDFLNADCKVKLLLADIHGALDHTPWELLEKRYEYYEIVIPAMLKALGADLSRFEIVRGSDFQTSREYVFDMYRLSTIVSIHDCQKASSEVVKAEENPRLAGLLYPIMQALDEQYLGVDIQYGGIDQRKILVLARENLPKIGYKARVDVMTPLVPGLAPGGKMSASVKGSKIDLLDDPKAVQEKLRNAFCPEGEVEGNGVLAFIKNVLMVLKQDAGEEFVIERPEKFGGNLSYSSYEELEADYTARKIHPLDLKAAMAREVNQLLNVVHEAMRGKESLTARAYPE